MPLIPRLHSKLPAGRRNFQDPPGNEQCNPPRGKCKLGTPWKVAVQSCNLMEIINSILPAIEHPLIAQLSTFVHNAQFCARHALFSGSQASN